MNNKIITLKGKAFDCYGIHPDGILYTHGVCVVSDLWEIPNYPDSFGIALKDENKCGWCWPGIDKVKFYNDGKIKFLYTGGIPMSTGLLILDPVK